ncbi:spore germination protein [Bacillus sp. 3103sda1]|uniref:spore germination protein n=1 Tax=Bacillus sp. 3103sda1 TaxID=2953808 RepID=UPI0020A0FEC4|nr:spore germination protein [Bacillus sp. 3103sda1]MCP1125625.1 spore germination protein [Bacillus sp. 3103sda1]
MFFKWFSRKKNSTDATNKEQMKGTQQTKQTEQQPEQQQAQASKQQPEQQQAQASKQQPEQQQAQASKQQPEQQQAQANKQQPEQQQAQASKQQPEQQQAQASKQQPEQQQAQANKQQPEQQQAQASKQQPEQQQAQASKQQPEQQQAQANKQQPEQQQPEQQQAQANKQQPEQQQAQASKQQPEQQQAQANKQQPKQQQAQTNKQQSNKQYSKQSKNGIFDFSKPEHEAAHSLQELFQKLKESSDFVHSHTSEDPAKPYWISYFRTSMDGMRLQNYLMPALLHHTAPTLEEIKEMIPISGLIITSDVKKIEEMVLKGHAIIQLQEHDTKCLLANIAIEKYRLPSIPLNESTVTGPQEGFVEDIDTNINLVRKRLPVLELKTKELLIGEFSKTKVVMMYLSNLAEKETIAYLEGLLNKIQYDQINDSNYIAHLMGDTSIFPTFITTERADRVSSGLVDGKIAIFVDGAPNILLAPVSLLDFFVSPEDYSVSWFYATFSRLLRFIAIIFSIAATPLYVAVLSYHYELIPSDLLETLILSRAQVPFPPLIEAIFLELAIDLLREAGARLPMKVGQTLGIVGGIVIGQASVQAGLTSNILLIIVALSALASFITPIYKMGNAVRILRFPFLILAELWGLLGISLGFIFLLTRLFRLSSLRKPYGFFYPFRKQSIKDSLIQLPLSKMDTRNIQSRPQHVGRYVKEVFQKRMTDFDE